MSKKSRNNSSSVTAVVGPVVHDLVRPATTEIGHTVGRSVRALLLPVNKALGGWESVVESIADAIEEKLKGRTASELREPPAYIAGPALEAARWSADEPELRSLFANLLASSMLVSEDTPVHPAFVELLKQLTPDEARILKCLEGVGRLAAVHVWSAGGADKGARYAIDLLPLLTSLRDRAGCLSPNNEPLYLENLQRLGLIYIRLEKGSALISSEDDYSAITSSDWFRVAYAEHSRAHPDSKIVTTRGCIEVTELGEAFINTCVKDPASARR